MIKLCFNNNCSPALCFQAMDIWKWSILQLWV